MRNRPSKVHQAAKQVRSTNDRLQHFASRYFLEAAVPPVVQQPSARLLCTNLPQEVTDNVLSVLFQQYVLLGQLYGCLNYLRKVSRLPDYPCCTVADTKCNWRKNQDGTSVVRYPRSCLGSQRSIRRVFS